MRRRSFLDVRHWSLGGLEDTCFRNQGCGRDLMSADRVEADANVALR
jgi:hypothetical protein